MIDLSVDKKVLEKTAERLRQKQILLPTFEEMANPEKIPAAVKRKLKDVGLWDINPLNLFRITWKNEPVFTGGGFGGVNYLEIPPSITGVKARIVGLVGKWFPTGAHKVGATYGCLSPALATGRFDPTAQKAVWPSTGNYCRGGAFNSTLIGCESVAILPEEMSNERFEWLQSVAGEIIATPGCESNVKEIYDKCDELRRTRDDVVIFNQFDEFGNYLWHYWITGPAMEEVLGNVLSSKERLAGIVGATGSAGTVACGDYVKEKYPLSKVAVSEALQCPTLIYNGYGGHRIEGIGDKHVPWIHNVRNTDMVIALDDADTMNVMRLFNEKEGKAYLTGMGLQEDFVENLPLLGISGIGNLIGSIKFAKYYELTENDTVFTIFTDSMELYQSRIREMNEEEGAYTRENAVRDYHRSLMGQSVDHMLELGYYDKKRIHNLKYFTWVEQQGKEVAELDAQWYDYPDYWEAARGQLGAIEDAIKNLNKMTGVLGLIEK